MSELIANCPRCKSKQITFDLANDIFVKIEYDWKQWHEAFCICRACRIPTIFVLSRISHQNKGKFKENNLSQLPHAVNRHMKVVTYISLKDETTEQTPEHLPENIKAVFREVFL